VNAQKCLEYYKLYKDLEEKILDILGSRKISFDMLREELERIGIYMDGRCLRKKVAEMIRAGMISKTPDPESRKLLLGIAPSSPPRDNGWHYTP